MVLCSRCKKRPAIVFMTRMDGDKSTPEGFCIQCAKELGIAPVDQVLSQFNLSEENLDELNEQLMELMDGDDENDLSEILPGGAATFPFLNTIFGNGGQKAADAAGQPEETKEAAPQPEKKRRKKVNEKKRKVLNEFCTSLNQKAKDGAIDRMIGREREIYRVIQILSRRQKNNPCLIGEPGVGKTAIAEGLALKIVQGDVPAALQEKEIMLLDLASLVAGTQFRGQFEKRIKALVDEIKQDGNIILFIDEVHNLAGVGDAEGSMNAANILKPSLSRGEIQVIGATTFTEYRKYIEKDAALERRFQPVTVEEPSVSETVDILCGIKDYYEQHHHVTVTEELLRRAAALSERYITDRFLPDKAIDLLDEACACANLRNKEMNEMITARRRVEQLREEEGEMESEPEQDETDYARLAEIKTELAKYRVQLTELERKNIDNSVTVDDLARVIELWTGIPAAKVRQSDLKQLAGLEDRLRAKVIGQDEAVHLVAAAIKRSRVQISARRRPASFLFVGPTGVGKTELVKVLSAELFDTPETLIRLDMSEFMEKHSVSRIIGAPPGYVGYDEAGQLTEKVRRKPYSVVLLDEIEKAHPDVLNILLQILDDGRITDAHGRTVNFENTVIVMTSNAGSDKRDSALGFGASQHAVSRDKAMKALNEFLRPEFISRVDEIVFFNDLSGEDYQKIAALMLEELKASMKEKHIALVWDDGALRLIAEKSHGGKNGARDLRNYIRRNVEDKIAELLVEHCDEPVSGVSVTSENGGLKLSYL